VRCETQSGMQRGPVRTLKPGEGFSWIRAVTPVCILALSLSAAAQTTVKHDDSGTQSASPGEIQTVDGCLYNLGQFESVGTDYGYELHGDTAALEKHLGEEVRLTGVARKKSENMYSLDVTSVKTVFKAPILYLPSVITDASNWKTQVNEKYGVKFGLPTFPSYMKAGGAAPGPNSVAEPGTVTLAGLDIPSGIYPKSNFTGGTFLLFVNPTITNRGSCQKFATFDPRSISYHTIAGTAYSETSEGDAAAGSSSDTEYFHTFQNGMCFEIALTTGFYDTSNQDLGCRVPIPGDAAKLIDEFVSRISYFPGSEKVPPPRRA
jgi:hypothetical protein